MRRGQFQPQKQEENCCNFVKNTENRASSHSFNPCYLPPSENAPMLKDVALSQPQCNPPVMALSPSISLSYLINKSR